MTIQGRVSLRSLDGKETPKALHLATLQNLISAGAQYDIPDICGYTGKCLPVITLVLALTRLLALFHAIPHGGQLDLARCLLEGINHRQPLFDGSLMLTQQLEVIRIRLRASAARRSRLRCKKARKRSSSMALMWT